MADVVATDARTLNAREMRAVGHAAAGREGVDLMARAGITDVAEGRVVTRATERMRENDWRKALETIGQQEPADMHWAGWQDIVPGQIFTDVDAAGERMPRGGWGMGTPEEQRQTRINTAMGAYDALIQNGYRSLLPRSAERTRIDTILTDTMRGNPQLRELYMNNATPPVLIPAQVEQLMEDPALKKHLAAALNDVYEPGKRFPMVEVQKAVEAYTKANTELTNLATERATAVATAAVTDAMWDAQPSSIAGTNRGPRMASLRTQARTAPPFAPPVHPATTGHDGLTAAQLLARRSDIQSFPDLLEQRDTLLNIPENRRNHAAIQRLDERLNSARNDSTYGARVAELQELFEQRKQNKIDRDTAAAKIPEIDGKIVDKTAEVNVARAAQADQLREARAHSTKFEQSINRALAKAAKNTVGEKIGAYMAAFVPAEKEALDVAKQENTSRVSAEVQRRLTKTTRRWINYLPGTGWLGNNKREVLNERQIRKDARVLLRGGPEALVRQVLVSARVPNGEMELLLRDPAFMQQQGKEMYGKVLAGYIMTGGKIPVSQYEAMSMSSWGPQVLNEMISKNAEAKAMIEQHTGQPYTEQSLKQLLADPDNQKWIRRALLTAGGIGLFYAGPGAIVNAAAAIGGAINHVAGAAALEWADAAKDYIIDPLAAGHAGAAIGKGIDAGVGAAQVAGKAVSDNVAAIGNSTALQSAGAEIGRVLTEADKALLAGNVGTAVGEGAKEVVERAGNTKDVIAANITAAKTAFTKP